MGTTYIDYLLVKKQFQDAAEWCTKILVDCKSWEEKILIFAKESHLEVIVVYLELTKSID